MTAEPPPRIAEWSARLRAVARKAIADTPLTDPGAPVDARRAYLDAFADERGNRPRIATPFLAAALGVAPRDRPTGPADLDDRLWWSVHAPPTEPLPPVAPRGMLDPAPNDAIEPRTETELAAMHALFRLGLDRGRPELVARALDAARWHVDELQPDNGTNRPWAVHVFVALADTAEGPDESAAAAMHAQTLLHNCQVQQGRADRFSAWVLWDAARDLDRWASGGR